MKYVLSLGLLLLFATTAQAETTTNCQPVYGGGQTCQQSNSLSINKKVLRSELTFQQGQTYQESDFVDHISTKNKPYSPNQQTAFRLTVTNTSNRDITDITVEDLLPNQYITYVAGQGEFNDQTKTFSTKIDKLKPNESRAFTIQVMTARAEELPEGSGLICSVNQARATAGNQVAEDNSQLCMNKTGATPSSFPQVQGQQTVTPQTTKGGLPIVTNQPTQSKGGLPVTQTPQTNRTPETGPEHLLLLGPLAGVGMYLRKKASFLS